MNLEWIMWVILAMLFFVVELIKPKWVVFWFAIGSVVAAITSVVIPQFPSLLARLPMNIFYLDIIIFFGVSLILLAFARPIATRLFIPEHRPTNIRAAVGREEMCLEDIDNFCKRGAVRLFGTPWNARSSRDDVIIKAGTKVRIVDIDGLCLVVEPVYQKSSQLLSEERRGE
jgi:membrane protein implicated in regulation of membrane protease activity